MLAVALVTAFVGKGLNAPFRSVNGFLYTHVPGMVLLREPMGKIGIVLVPAVVLGWVLTLDGLAARWTVDLHDRPARAMLGRVGLIALVVAPAVFAAPMLTGTVVKPSDRVRVPAAWYQVARIVNDDPLQGKALVLPLDDFYQVPTTWGFYGADTLPIQLLHRPTITRNPERYIGDSGDFEQLVQAVQDAIIGGDPEAVPGALRALGVSHIIVRKDIDFASSIRAVQMTPPGPLLAGLTSVANVRHVATTKVADVYEFTPGNEPVVALSGTIAAPGAHGEALASLVAGAPVGTAIATTEPGKAPLYRGISWYVDVNGNRTIVPPGAGDWLYQWHTSDTALLELAARPAAWCCASRSRSRSARARSRRAPTSWCRLRRRSSRSVSTARWSTSPADARTRESRRARRSSRSYKGRAPPSARGVGSATATVTTAGLPACAWA